jgi:hypothetical protein
MTLETAKQLKAGTKVRLCPGGAEIEVDHDYDGGGFDFWPRASVDVEETPYEAAMEKEHAR